MDDLCGSILTSTIEEHSHAVGSFRTPGEPVYASAADCADQQTFAAMILRDPSHQVEQIQHKYHADWAKPASGYWFDWNWRAEVIPNIVIHSYPVISNKTKILRAKHGHALKYLPCNSVTMPPWSQTKRDGVCVCVLSATTSLPWYSHNSQVYSKHGQS